MREGCGLKPVGAHMLPCSSSSLSVLLRCRVACVDSMDFFMVCAICCAPPLGWSRLMLIPMLNTSDRTRTTWATARQTGLQHFAGFNPHHLQYMGCKFGIVGRNWQDLGGGNRRIGTSDRKFSTALHVTSNLASTT